LSYKNRRLALRGNHDYKIFFDDIQVDHLVESYSCTISCNGSYNSASITMIYHPDLDRITHNLNKDNVISYNLNLADNEKRVFTIDDGVENMTNIRIFVKNIFSGRYIQIFEGNVRAKRSSIIDGERSITFVAYDYMNWLNRILCPWTVSINSEIFAPDLLQWAAYGIKISDAVIANSTTNQYENKALSLAVAINRAIQFSYLNNIFLSEEDSVLAWDKPLLRFDLMGDISEKLRNESFWGNVIETTVTRTDSFYLKLQQILNNLIFEYFQDRDGIIRIKPSFWNMDVLKNSVIDSSMIQSFNDETNWNNFYTRMVCKGEADQIYTDDATMFTPTAVATFKGAVTSKSKEAAQNDKVLNISGTSAATNDNAVGEDGLVCYPYIDSFTITQKWKTGTHNGIDLVGSSNTAPLYSIVGGEVTHVNDELGHTQGYCLEVYSERYNVYVVFMHMNSAPRRSNGLAIKKGDTVTAGELVGYQGNTGESRGYHLHLEVNNVPWAKRKTTNNWNANPAAFIGIENVEGKSYVLISKSNKNRSGGSGNSPYDKSKSPSTVSSGIENNIYPSISYDYDEEAAKKLLEMSEMEKRYGPLIDDKTQPMIKFENVEGYTYGFDSSSATESEIETKAYEALVEYAKFELNYRNAESSVANATTVSMPWLRPGTNVWIDPTSIDKIFYLSSITHSGNPKSGCFSSLTLNIGRRRENFLNGTVAFGARLDNGTQDIFVSEVYKDVSTFGETVDDYDKVREDLDDYHKVKKEKVLNAELDENILKTLYTNDNNTIRKNEVSFEASGDNFGSGGTDDKKTVSGSFLVFDGEYSLAQIQSALTDLYTSDSTPDIIKKRRSRLKSIIENVTTVMKSIYVSENPIK